jgi:hypothetical protein
MLDDAARALRSNNHLCPVPAGGRAPRLGAKAPLSGSFKLGNNPSKRHGTGHDGAWQ